MAALEEEEPLDGDCGEYDSYGEEQEEEEDDDDTASTANDDPDSTNSSEGNSEGLVPPAVPFPGTRVRESLGFLTANKKIAVPGVRFGDGGDDDGRVAALAALDRFGILLISSATGILVYDIKALVSTAFGVDSAQGREVATTVPVRAEVGLGGRPSCMVVSPDSSRVAAAVGNKVLIFDAPSLIKGGATPLATVSLSSRGGGDSSVGDGGSEPSRALCWGSSGGERQQWLLLVVRADRTAVVARIADGAEAGREAKGSDGGGGSVSVVVEDVAGGRQDFTAGCFLSVERQGQGQEPGRLVLGTSTGELEVYRFGEEGGGAGGGLWSCECVTSCPSELKMSGIAEVNHVLLTQTGSLWAVYYDSEADNEDAARIAEFDVATETLGSDGLMLKTFEDPEGDAFLIFPSYDAPESSRFRSHLALATLEGEHLVVVSSSVDQNEVSMLTTKACASESDGDGWTVWTLEESWDFMPGQDAFPRGLCFSESWDAPVPAQKKTHLADHYRAGPVAFRLTTKGKLECSAVVHPLQPDVVLRRKTAEAPKPLPAAAAATAPGVGEEKTEVQAPALGPAPPKAKSPVFGSGTATKSPFGSGSLVDPTAGDKNKTGKTGDSAQALGGVFGGGFGAKPTTPAFGSSSSASPFGAFASQSVTNGGKSAPSGFGSFAAPGASGSAGSTATTFGSFASKTPSGGDFPPMSSKAPSVFGSSTTSAVGQGGATGSFSFGSSKVDSGGAKPAFPFGSPTASTAFSFSSTNGKDTAALPFGSPKATPKAANPPAAGSVAGKASSSSGYPPMSATGPSVFGVPAKPVAKPSASSSSSGYPPMSSTAPSVFGAPAKAAAKPAGSAAGATKPVAKPSASSSSSGYPPMSSTAPSVFGAPAKPVAKPSASSSSSGYPPMSSTAPSVFGAPAKPVAKPSASSSSSGYPPMSSTAPSVFGAPDKAAAKPAGSAAGATKHVAKPSASPSSSGYPPMSSTAPSVFGAPEKAAAKPARPTAGTTKPVAKPSAPTFGFGSGGGSYPPMSSTAPSVFGSSKPHSTAKPAVSKSGPSAPLSASSVFGVGGTPFGAPKPAAGFGSSGSKPTLGGNGSSGDFGRQQQVTGVSLSTPVTSTAPAATSGTALRAATAGAAGSSIPSAPSRGLFGSGGSGGSGGLSSQTSAPVSPPPPPAEASLSRSASVAQAVVSDGGRGRRNTDEEKEWEQDFGDGGEDDECEDFNVPEIPGIRTPRRSQPGGARDIGRKAIPSTAAEGVAWKNLLEVLEHLQELKEQGANGQLRDPAWSYKMNGAVEGLRDTVGRLREAVGKLGKETAAQVTEMATLKANNQDIRWQATTAEALLKCDENSEAEDGGEPGVGNGFGGDDGRESLDPDLIHIRKSIRRHKRNIEAGMSDLQATLKSRRERRADLVVAQPGHGQESRANGTTPQKASLSSSNGTPSSSRAGASSASASASASPLPGAMSGRVKAGGSNVRAGVIHGVLPRARRGNRSGATAGAGGAPTTPSHPSSSIATPERGGPGLSAASQRRRSVGGAGGAGGTPSAPGPSPAPGSSTRGYRRRPSISAPGGGGSSCIDTTSGGGGGPQVAAERQGLQIMRIVGSQYDATIGVEAWVARAEAKIKQLERAAAAAVAAAAAKTDPVGRSSSSTPTAAGALAGAAAGTLSSSSSSSALTVREKREDALTRGRRLRREQKGVSLFAKETSRLSFSFPQREVGGMVTQDQLAERLGNKPSSISTPQQQQRTPSRLVTSGRGPGSFHQASSASASASVRRDLVSSPSVAAAGKAAAAKIRGATITKGTASKPDPVQDAVGRSHAPSAGGGLFSPKPAAAAGTTATTTGGGLITRTASVADAAADPSAGGSRRERTGSATGGGGGGASGDPENKRPFHGMFHSFDRSAVSGAPATATATGTGKAASASASTSTKPNTALPSGLLFGSGAAGVKGTTAAAADSKALPTPSDASTAAKSSGGYPPMSLTAPSVFGAKKTPAGSKGPAASAAQSSGSSGGTSGYPPMSVAAPSVFGAVTKKSSTSEAAAPATTSSTTGAAAHSSAAPAPAAATAAVATKPSSSTPIGFGSKSSAAAAPAATKAAASDATTASSLPTPFGAGSGFGTTKPSPFGGNAPKSSPFGGSASASIFGGGSSLATSGTSATASTPASAASTAAPGFVGLSTLSSTAATTPAPTPAQASSGTFGMSSFGASLGAAATSTSSAATPAAAAPAAAGAVDYRAQVYEIYNTYNKSKLGEVDKILKKYAGQEASLIKKLHKKYNVQPAAGAGAGAGTTSVASPFSTPSKAAATPGAGLFGPSAAPPSGGVGPSPFGAGAGFSAPKPSPFGTGFGQPSAASPASPFGKQQQPSAAAPAPSTFGSFSASTPTPFGAPPAATAAPAASPFGTPSAGVTASSPFGAGSTAAGGAAASGAGASMFAPPAAGRGDPAVLRSWMQEVYAKHKPENVPKIERFLAKYAGNEWKMIEGILKKYAQVGVVPPAGWSAPPAGGAAAPAQAPVGFGQQAQTGFGQGSAFGTGGGAPGFGQQPFGQTSSTGFGATTSTFGKATAAPTSTPFGGGGFGATSALGGGSVFGAPAPSAAPASTTPAAGGFSAFASGSQPSFGSAAATPGVAGAGGFGAFASKGGTGGGFGAAASSGGFGAGGGTASGAGGGFSGSSFRQMRG